MANPKLVTYVASVAGVIGATKLIGERDFELNGFNDTEIDEDDLSEEKNPIVADWEEEKEDLTEFDSCMEAYFSCLGTDTEAECRDEFKTCVEIFHDRKQAD